MNGGRLPLRGLPCFGWTWVCAGADTHAFGNGRCFVSGRRSAVYFHLASRSQLAFINSWPSRLGTICIPCFACAGLWCCSGCWPAAVRQRKFAWEWHVSVPVSKRMLGSSGKGSSSARTVCRRNGIASCLRIRSRLFQEFHARPALAATCKAVIEFQPSSCGDLKRFRQ